MHTAEQQHHNLRTHTHTRERIATFHNFTRVNILVKYTPCVTRPLSLCLSLIFAALPLVTVSPVSMSCRLRFHVLFGIQ